MDSRDVPENPAEAMGRVPKLVDIDPNERVLMWAGGELRWPGSAVMNWNLARNILRFEGEDDPDAVYGYEEYADEEMASALESERMEQLRGMFLGQAAEVEAAILELAGHLYPPGRGRRSLGQALGLVRDALRTRGDSASAPTWMWLGHLRWLHSRRNQLVHARLTVGMARQHERSDLEPVISLLIEIRGSTAIDWQEAPSWRGEMTPVTDPMEIDEGILEADCWRAWVATCSAAALSNSLAPVAFTEE